MHICMCAGKCACHVYTCSGIACLRISLRNALTYYFKTLCHILYLYISLLREHIPVSWKTLGRGAVDSVWSFPHMDHRQSTSTLTYQQPALGQVLTGGLELTN